jgi:murein DD-endopeptidase MepM/ murein hydrolase activator NlpD
MSAVTKSKSDKKKWYSKLRNKYRLVISNEETFEEKISFRLSRLNVFVVAGTITIFLIVGTIFLIAFTPLREYIPGYTDVSLYDKVKRLQYLTDSLEVDMNRKSMYIQNIKRIVEGKDFSGDTALYQDEGMNLQDVHYSRSSEDSILREVYDNESSFDLYYNENEELSESSSPVTGYNFFNPLKGIITSEFNMATQHYGVDIVANRNDAVKATLDGTVIFADWTVKTGHVISIQHKGNFISVYKHNSMLLKNQGSFVKAGEPIAIVGESGELSTGPHLHFELWYNGAPVNPREYIAF